MILQFFIVYGNILRKSTVCIYGKIIEKKGLAGNTCLTLSELDFLTDYLNELFFI